uniref:Virion structural protein n=1 Tax=Pseudomonas phage RVTF4 TaxID=3236931 RepID=A0AB39CCL8_9VIRU
MLQTFTISNEVISVDVSRELGKLIQAQVAKMRRSYEVGGKVAEDTLKGLSDIVKMTGLNVEFISTPGPHPDAWMMTFMYWGHQGTTWSKYFPQEARTSKDGLKYVTKVDLKNLKVSGPMVDELKYKSNCAEAFFRPSNEFTDEEITGIILHEIGHAFNVFVTLSDYIWLNYMLSDGVDVLLGNKRNEYNLEVLDQTWVEKNIPPKQRDEWANKRSPENIKRAILSLYKKAPRHYLYENPGSAHMREEQMADMFANRLGYGRYMIKGLDRMYKAYGMKTDYRSSWVGNLVRAAFLLVFLPFTLLWMITLTGTCDMDFGGRYDGTVERVEKVRLDLINQLKTIKDRTMAPAIQADIEAIDEILKDYHKGTNLFDWIGQFVSPQLRMETKLKVQEENIEHLLNNDLFYQAHRYQPK